MERRELQIFRKYLERRGPKLPAERFALGNLAKCAAFPYKPAAIKLTFPSATGKSCCRSA